MSSPEKYREVFLGLSLPHTDFVDLNKLSLNNAENRDLLALKEWPEGTQVVTISPAELADLFTNLKPERISQLVPELPEKYQGLILAQVIITPAVDISETVRRAFKKGGCGLYQPQQVLMRDVGIRCWVNNSTAEIG